VGREKGERRKKKGEGRREKGEKGFNVEGIAVLGIIAGYENCLKADK